MSTGTGQQTATILDSTETYLEQIETCLSHLPDAIDAYGKNHDAFVTSVDRLRCLESDCDATVQRLRALAGEGVDPTDAEVYMRLDDVTRLYGLLDAIPNRAETFLREFRAAQPTLSTATHEKMQLMAEDAARAMSLLVTVVRRYVRSLTAGEPAVDIADDVQTITAMESACDDRRDTILSTVFVERTTAEAVLVRELLAGLDGIVDAIEDAAEHILSMNSSALGSV